MGYACVTYMPDMPEGRLLSASRSDQISMSELKIIFMDSGQSDTHACLLSGFPRDHEKALAANALRRWKAMTTGAWSAHIRTIVALRERAWLAFAQCAR